MTPVTPAMHIANWEAVVALAVLFGGLTALFIYLKKRGEGQRTIQSKTGHLLRASYIWMGEVMEDTLVGDGEAITLGHKGKSTFTIPDLNLPQGYAILRPGARGYVLTVGKGMSGTVSVSNQEQDIGAFVGADGSESSFKGTAVNAGDWGVINLNGSEDHQLFFQFVKNSAVASRELRDTDLLAPAASFALMLHAILLVVAFALKPDGNAAVFPGKMSLAADYLVNKPPPAIEEEEDTLAATDDGEEDAEPTSTAGEEGQAGGEGDEERARDEAPDKGEPDEPIPERIQKGLLTKESRRDIMKTFNRGGFDKKLGSALARLPGPKNNGSMAGFGSGSGTGVGEGTGTGTLKTGGKGGSGGGGNALSDVVTQKSIKTGGKRPPKGRPGGSGLKERKIKLGSGSASGKLGGLTAAEINKVVRSRRNAIKACYSRQLQHNRGLSGKIKIKWSINSSGSVTSARVVQNTMGNGKVGDCIVRQVQNMKFPKPRGGSKAVVTYPFGFTQQ